MCPVSSPYTFNDFASSSSSSKELKKSWNVWPLAKLPRQLFCLQKKKKTWLLTCYRKITELQVCFMTCHGSYKFGIKSLTAVPSNYCPVLHYCVFSVLTNPLPGIQACFSTLSQLLYPKCLQSGRGNNNFNIKSMFWLKTKYWGEFGYVKDA